MQVATQINQARTGNNLNCPQNGCFACRPFEAILSRDAEFVGVTEYNQDTDILN